MEYVKKCGEIDDKSKYCDDYKVHRNANKDNAVYDDSESDTDNKYTHINDTNSDSISASSNNNEI